MTWRDELLAQMKLRWRVGATFTLDEIYEFEGHFAALYPRNQYVRDKLRQQLQVLRDAGKLEFLDNVGHYRLLG